MRVNLFPARVIDKKRRAVKLAFCYGHSAESLSGFAGGDSVRGRAIYVERPHYGFCLEQVLYHLVDGGVLLTVVAFGILSAIPEAEREDPRVFCVRCQDGFVYESSLFLENGQDLVIDGVRELTRLSRFAG